MLLTALFFGLASWMQTWRFQRVFTPLFRFVGGQQQQQRQQHTSIDSKSSKMPAIIKPPNVLVYSDSPATRAAVIALLDGRLLARDAYTVYALNAADARASDAPWLDNTHMLVVCGAVASPAVGRRLTEFFLHGGRMLALCSAEMLHLMLPMAKKEAANAKARVENNGEELVQFSYGKWQAQVRRMNISSEPNSPLELPKSVGVQDLQQKTHNVQLQVLSTKETCTQPSLILATEDDSGGRAVFAQVHLESNSSSAPNENNNQKSIELQQSDTIARLEILSDLLSSRLGVRVRSADELADQTPASYTVGHLLGDAVAKSTLIARLRSSMTEPNTLRLPDLSLRFCDGKPPSPPPATEHLLPVLTNSATPDDFSSPAYFGHLQARSIGRLLIYAPVMTSTQHVIAGGSVPWPHGVAAVARRLTAGRGRGGNRWLSPDGCLMFSVQLHVPLASPMGQRLSLLQHLVAVAVVQAVHGLGEGYTDLNIGLKWPNDIYANGRTKLGGLIVTSQLDSRSAVCNIGVGVNLDNAAPTTCINDMIEEYNRVSGQKPLAKIGYEQMLAAIFSEMERLFEAVQTGDVQQLYTAYERLWLHGGAQVEIVAGEMGGERQSGRIVGIDEYGFLLVKLPGREQPQAVQPDGNSFDMLRGLIGPKSN